MSLQSFTGAANADSEGISNWVLKRLDETAAWVDLPGTKSLALDRLLQKGPALILFTPDNPYHTANDPFNLVSWYIGKEIILLRISLV